MPPPAPRGLRLAVLPILTTPLVGRVIFSPSARLPSGRKLAPERTSCRSSLQPQVSTVTQYASGDDALG